MYSANGVSGKTRNAPCSRATLAATVHVPTQLSAFTEIQSGAHTMDDELSHPRKRKSTSNQRSIIEDSTELPITSLPHLRTSDYVHGVM